MELLEFRLREQLNCGLTEKQRSDVILDISLSHWKNGCRLLTKWLVTNLGDTSFRFDSRYIACRRHFFQVDGEWVYKIILKHKECSISEIIELKRGHTVDELEAKFKVGLDNLLHAYLIWFLEDLFNLGLSEVYKQAGSTGVYFHVTDNKAVVHKLTSDAVWFNISEAKFYDLLRVSQVDNNFKQALLEGVRGYSVLQIVNNPSLLLREYITYNSRLHLHTKLRQWAKFQFELFKTKESKGVAYEYADERRLMRVWERKEQGGTVEVVLPWFDVKTALYE